MPSFEDIFGSRSGSSRRPSSYQPGREYSTYDVSPMGSSRSSRFEQPSSRYRSPYEESSSSSRYRSPYGESSSSRRRDPLLSAMDRLEITPRGRYGDEPREPSRFDCTSSRSREFECCRPRPAPLPSTRRGAIQMGESGYRSSREEYAPITRRGAMQMGESGYRPRPLSPSRSSSRSYRDLESSADTYGQRYPSSSSSRRDWDPYGSSSSSRRYR